MAPARDVAPLPLLQSRPIHAVRLRNGVRLVGNEAVSKAEKRISELLDRVERVPFSGCWIWMGCLNEDGYGKPRFLGREVYAHRIFYQHFNGPLSAEDCVLHVCDVRCCVNPQHLRKGSRSENLLDMWAKGRGRPKSFKGESHGMALLTAEQVVSIRSDTRAPARIAAEYSVSRSTIRAIKSRKTWAHLP